MGEQPCDASRLSNSRASDNDSSDIEVVVRVAVSF